MGSWFGKIAGAVIGGAIGGPFGAIIGAGLGHGADVAISGPEQPSRADGPAAARHPSAEEWMLLAFAMLAGKLAKIDGWISPEEIRIVSSFLDSLRVTDQDRAMLQKIFREAKESPHSPDEIARQFRMVSRGDRQAALHLTAFLLHIAHADGTYSRDEEAFMARVVAALELPAAEFESLRKSIDPRAVANEYFTVLGLQPGASRDQVKARYRELVKKFHPDRIAGKDLDEEFVRFANERLAAINHAYEMILKQAG